MASTIIAADGLKTCKAEVEQARVAKDQPVPRGCRYSLVLFGQQSAGLSGQYPTEQVAIVNHYRNDDADWTPTQWEWENLEGDESTALSKRKALIPSQLPSKRLG